MRHRILFKVFSLCAVLLNTACQSVTSSTSITNSKYFHLDPSKKIDSPDPMIRFEQLHYLHGAITEEQSNQRAGHYYVFWWNDNRTDPANVRFEYRQKNTGSQVHSRSIKAARPQRKNKTYFHITGKDYHANGRITAWRVSILRNGKVVASDQSYLW